MLTFIILQQYGGALLVIINFTVLNNLLLIINVKNMSFYRCMYIRVSFIFFKIVSSTLRERKYGLLLQDVNRIDCSKEHLKFFYFSPSVFDQLFGLKKKREISALPTLDVFPVYPGG